MATGYTTDVADGKVADFRTFALRCARAMGYCIMQHDESPTTLPRPTEPSNYHRGALVGARARLARLRTMSEHEAADAAQADAMQAQKRAEERAHANSERRARYESMLAQVRAWEPPTPDHTGLRSFMIDQLSESIQFDRNNDYRASQAEPPSVWLQARVMQAEQGVAYHIEEDRKEQEHTAKRNRWIAALYASLDGC